MIKEQSWIRDVHMIELGVAGAFDFCREFLTCHPRSKPHMVNVWWSGDVAAGSYIRYPRILVSRLPHQEQVLRRSVQVLSPAKVLGAARELAGSPAVPLELAAC